MQLTPYNHHPSPITHHTSPITHHTSHTHATQFGDVLIQYDLSHVPKPYTHTHLQLLKAGNHLLEAAYRAVGSLRKIWPQNSPAPWVFATELKDPDGNLITKNMPSMIDTQLFIMCPAKDNVSVANTALTHLGLRNRTANPQEGAVTNAAVIQSTNPENGDLVVTLPKTLWDEVTKEKRGEKRGDKARFKNELEELARREQLKSEQTFS